MKYVATGDRKKLKEAKDELNSLDTAILTKCLVSRNITRVIKAGKPFWDKNGRRTFATTREVLASVDKLIKQGLLKREVTHG